MEILFECVAKNACKLRRTNKNANGLLYWQNLKKLLEPVKDVKASNFKKINTKLYEEIMHLPEFTIDALGNKKLIELSHFLIQLVRIPTNEQPEIIKILQLAYNFGQYNGSVSKMMPDIKKLDSLECFITKSQIVSLDKQLATKECDCVELCKKITKLFESKL
jgi:hypothetical protein